MMTGYYNKKNQIDLGAASAQELHCELAAVNLWEILVHLQETIFTSEEKVSALFSRIVGDPEQFIGDAAGIKKIAVQRNIINNLVTPETMRDLMVVDIACNEEESVLRAMLEQTPFYRGMVQRNEADFDMLNQLREAIRRRPEAALDTYAKHYHAAIRALDSATGYGEPLPPS